MMIRLLTNKTLVSPMTRSDLDEWRHYTSDEQAATVLEREHPRLYAVVAECVNRGETPRQIVTRARFREESRLLAVMVQQTAEWLRTTR